MKTKLLHPAVTGALFLLSSPAFTHASSDTRTLQEVALSEEDCKKKLSPSLSDPAAIYSDSRVKSEYDPDQQCVKNAGGEAFSHNAVAVEKYPDILHKRGHFNLHERGNEFLKNRGACRLAYDGMKDLYDTFAKAREEYCRNQTLALQAAQQCSGVPDTKCRTQWEAWRDSHLKYVTGVMEKGKPGAEYLKGLELAVKTAKESYEADLRKLEAVFGKVSTDAVRAPSPGGGANPASPPALETLPEDPTVRASNGNAATNTSRSLADYYNLLKGIDLPASASLMRRDRAAVNRPGDLIFEEDVARRKLVSFASAMRQQQQNYIESARNAADYMDKQLTQLAKNGTTDESAISKINKFTPTVTAAAPLAQKMFQPDQNGLSQAAALPHAPVAEVAAAGAIGAIAARNFGGASQAAPAAEAPAAPPAAPVPPPKADVSNFHDSGEPRGPEKAGVTTTPVANNVSKTDSGKVDLEPGVSSHGSFGAFGADGASRTPSTKKGAGSGSTPAGAGGTAVDAGGAGTGDNFGASFTTNLEPRAAPKAAATNPGSEVANLLGQMKNLFNFDEGNPMGAGGMHGGGAMPVAIPSDPGFNPGGMPVGEEATPVAEGEAVPVPAGEAVPVGASPHGEEIRANPFGKVDTSLFARVRARHHRCMERGLVMYELRERVE